MTEGHEAPSLQSLKSSGADKFDPARFVYIEAMARRARAQSDPVKKIVRDKTRQALRSYQQDFLAARAQARCIVDLIAEKYPERASTAKQLLEDCKFRQVAKLQARLASDESCSPVATLKELIAKGDRVAHGNPREMESTRRFRDSLAKVNADKLLARAIQDAPESPGPLNPEMLAIRSLSVMRELSPHYLSRFVSYVDTLLWLDQPTGRTSSQKE